MVTPRTIDAHVTALPTPIYLGCLRGYSEGCNKQYIRSIDADCGARSQQRTDGLNSEVLQAPGGKANLCITMF
ncbi:hypothetical protein cyc_02108 [Cyclospora cayetanensis]|uniref:Uncharacterized protein n=1 Tax=Cyclospora cayetanensis TaxID=88456 RepID=A0A1D3CWQ7_9EIME|nr:hypothetical protein cyc_02108 [Cyclospora cayetanensis]